MRPTRDILHLITALMWSKRSTCKRLQVGTVITNEHMDKILSYGYNGPPAKMSDDACKGLEGGCGCYHSEYNAFNRMGHYEAGVRVFMTDSPCLSCAKYMRTTAGIRSITYIRRYRDNGGLVWLAGRDICVVQVPLENVLFAANALMCR